MATKIAVLSDMLELGSYSDEAHRQVGEMAAENNIDLLFTFGEASVNIAEGAKSKGMKNAFHFNSKEEMTAALLDTLEENDTVIFKASRGMKLEDVIHSVYDRWGK